MTGRCGASFFFSNTKTNSFGRATLISSDIGQTKTLEKGLKSGRNMCAPHREIELLVKLIIFLLQIYFRGTRRGSDKVPIHGTGKL